MFSIADILNHLSTLECPPNALAQFQYCSIAKALSPPWVPGARGRAGTVGLSGVGIGRRRSPPNGVGKETAQSFWHDEVGGDRALPAHTIIKYLPLKDSVGE